MSRSVHKAGDTHRAELSVYTAARVPVTGLTVADFTITLSKDGADVPVPATIAVTISEIGGGRYDAEWDDNGAGVFVLRIQPDDPTHYPAAWVETFDVTAGGVLSVADIQSGLATAAAQTTIIGHVDTLETEVAAAIAAIGAVPTANENADALLDRGDGVETGVTVRQALQRIGATTAGECEVSDGGSTVTFYGLDGTTLRVTATVVTTGPTRGTRTTSVGS